MQFFQHSERDAVYDLLTEYYNDPAMQKIRDVNHMSMYAIRLPCLLLNEKRYLIALVLQDSHPQGTVRNLKDLRWKSLMIRSLQDEQLASLPVHQYSIKRDDKFRIPLKIASRSREISTYDCTGGLIMISLLHTRNQEYEYPNEGTLVSALETFQTVIHWKEE